MKKVFIFFFIFLSMVLSVSAEDKPIITVLDFNSDGVSESEMKSIINYLSSSLFKTGKFTVIDVNQRENILNELEFSLSGCTDESCYLEVGKMLSAEGIVVGSLGRVGSRFLLTAKLLKTETGATISSADGMYKDLDELLDDIYKAAEELGKPFGDDSVFVEAEQPENIKKKPEAEETSDYEAEPEAVAEPDSEKVPADINWPAWGSLAGAAGCIGSGGYLLAVSLPLMFDYLDAQTAYDNAADADSAAALYTSAENARTAAVNGNVNLYIPLGIGLSAAGIGLGVLSAVLFSDSNRAEAETVQTAVLPVRNGVMLSFRMSY